MNIYDSGLEFNGLNALSELVQPLVSRCNTRIFSLVLWPTVNVKLKNWQNKCQREKNKKLCGIAVSQDGFLLFLSFHFSNIPGLFRARCSLVLVATILNLCCCSIHFAGCSMPLSPSCYLRFVRSDISLESGRMVPQLGKRFFNSFTDHSEKGERYRKYDHCLSMKQISNNSLKFI